MFLWGQVGWHACPREGGLTLCPSVLQVNNSTAYIISKICCDQINHICFRLWGPWYSCKWEKDTIWWNQAGKHSSIQMQSRICEEKRQFYSNMSLYQHVGWHASCLWKSVHHTNIIKTDSICVLYAGIDCGKPRKLINGYVNYTSTLFESTAVYRCKPGYQLVGKVTIVCLSHGQWSSTKTRCDGKRQL